MITTLLSFVLGVLAGISMTLLYCVWQTYKCINAESWYDE